MPETLNLAMLMGLGRLPREHEEFVHGSQLDATGKMFALRTALSMVSVGFVNLVFFGSLPVWLLAIWTVAVFGATFLSYNISKALERADFGSATRSSILRHGGVALVHGAIWAFPMIVMVDGASTTQSVALWTMTSCLMAAVSIALSATPLATTLFLFAVGSSAVWMMHQQQEPLLTAVVTTYVLLLLAASLRQAHQFGLQLTTNHQLAEKREVVSLLLKEHDVQGADWLWQTDAARRLTGVSDSFASMLGLASEEIEGKSILEVFAGPAWEEGQFDPALHLLAEKFKTKSPFSDLVMPVTVEGHQRWWEISASPRVDEKGVFLGFRGVGSDVTERKESAERIAQLAHYDVLTNLPNRLHLTEELGLAVENMHQWKRRCGFLMIDLDRFKQVNDTLGHLIGDQLLAQVAERLRSVCSPNELCGRLGGDEFAVVIRDVPDQIYAERLALAIIDAISDPYTVDNHTLFIGASVGSATAPRDGRTAETLIRSADLAMYKSKEEGGGRHFAYVPDMHADAEERRTLEISLRDALAKDELHLLFQPIVKSTNGEVTSFEALVRWTHPELGPIPPSKFIPIAEEARLITSIGNWVLRSACEEAVNWPRDVRISVNVSPEQLYDPAFLEFVVSALAHSGLPAHRLDLEVTESVFLREGTGVAQLLDKLMKLGVCLSLDDFGTGYSSLGYLSRTRFTSIKIDQSFVRGASKQQREAIAIIRAVVAMADSLDMTTTAEGVETEAEFELLRSLGCSRIQGYYFGRPMPASDVDALFKDRASRVA